MSRASPPEASSGTPDEGRGPDEDRAVAAGPSRGPGAVLGQILPGVAVAAVVALALTALSGAEMYARLGLPDPGAVVTYGVPIVRALTESAAVVTVGALLLAVVLAPPPDAGWLRGDGYRSVRVAGAAALVWAAGGLLTTVLVVADAFGRPVGAVLTGPVLWNSLIGLPTAQGWVASAVLALLCAGACRAALAWTTSAAAFGLALAGLLPVAFTGHSSTGGAHDLAVNSLVLHLLAAALWVGGLVALCVHAVARGAHLPVALRRFSALAGVCWVVLAASGTVNALIRLEPSELLRTTYGVLVLVKITGLVALGVFGARHRSVTLPAVAGGSRAALLRLGGVEVLVMFATIGVAVALGRTAPPSTPTELPTRAEALLGYTLTGPLDVTGVVTAARPHLLWGTAAVALAAAYLVAVRRLRGRGVPWPVPRTSAWLVGCLLLFVVTSSGLGAYGPAQFSWHMLAQVTVGVAVPALLVLGRPLVLVSASSSPCPDDAPADLRTTLAALGHAAPVRVLRNPAVATAVPVGTSWLLARSAVFDRLVATHGGHLAMTVAVFGAGTLFFSVVLAGRGVGPAPGPRVGMVVAALAAQVLLALAVIGAREVPGADHWADLDLPWADPAAEQWVGGVVLGVGGVVPLLLVLGALLFPTVRERSTPAGAEDAALGVQTPVSGR